jgi:hypothetical protein
MPNRIFSIILLTLAALASLPSRAASPLAAGQPLILGANANESAENLEPKLLKRTQTKWVRVFFPASHFLDGKTSLQSDDQILATKKLGELGHHLFLTIKWDNRQDYGNTAERRAPKPDSAEEKRAFAFASDLLNTFKGQVSALALVNELTVDSPTPMTSSREPMAPLP